jgi:hypothetical protein
MEHRKGKRNAAIYARRCSGLTLKEIGREFQLTKEPFGKSQGAWNAKLCMLH